MADPPSSHPQPTQIILFLENLWQFAEHNEAVYLDEVRITYLHELGHYFGFDEDDLEERGLE
jgi:predicted Zn-dependent protease with MMP-like domain